MICVGIAMVLLAIGPPILYLSAIALRIKGIKFSRVCLTFGVLLLLGIAFRVAYAFVPSAVPQSPSAIPLLIFEVLVQAAAGVFILRAMLKTATLRAIGCAVLYTVLAVGIALAARSTIVAAFVVPTSGMSPTILAGDRIMAEKITTRFRSPLRGEIVVFHPPPDVREVHVKRVVAVAGDRLELGDSLPDMPDANPLKRSPGRQILINGKSSGLRTYPPNLAPKQQMEYPAVVPPGKLFLVGDNYDESSDSRAYGFVDVHAVVARAEFIYASSVLPDPLRAYRDAKGTDDHVGKIRWERIGKFLDNSPK